MDKQAHDVVLHSTRDSKYLATGSRSSYVYRPPSRLITALLFIMTFAFCVLKGPWIVAATITQTGQPQQPIGELTPMSPIDSTLEEYCPQPRPLIPRSAPLHEDVLKYIRSEDYKNASISKFQKSITYRTVSDDEMLNPDFPLDDSRYEDFNNFRIFLSRNFPQIYRDMEYEEINTHGMLFTWKGSNTRLRPTLLCAHYDVVPVDDSSLADWGEIDPWAGDIHSDPENGAPRVYGRGATDMKHSLMSIMSALEALIERGFKPQRTIMIAFGFDEELGGRKGHLKISEEIEKRVGRQGIAVLTDEGGGQITQHGKSIVAVAVAEKGFVDVQVDVRVPGGHASLPDPHTAIGMASWFVTSLENNPYPVYLSKDHPMLSFFACGLDAMNEKLAAMLKARLEPNATWPDKEHDTLAQLLAQNASRENHLYWTMATTQAVTVINGGIKTNILPEKVTLKINHRIHPDEKLEEVKEKIEHYANLTAAKFNLTVFEFSSTGGNLDFQPPLENDRTISLIESRPLPSSKQTNSALEVGGKKSAYGVVAGTVLAIMGPNVIVAPSQNLGNTDSRHYWNVTDNIMRYIPGAEEKDGARTHTVLESMSVAGHMKGIEYFATFVRNMDEADLYDEK